MNHNFYFKFGLKSVSALLYANGLGTLESIPLDWPKVCLALTQQRESASRFSARECLLPGNKKLLKFYWLAKYLFHRRLSNCRDIFTDALLHANVSHPHSSPLLTTGVTARLTIYHFVGININGLPPRSCREAELCMGTTDANQPVTPESVICRLIFWGAPAHVMTFRQR